MEKTLEKEVIVDKPGKLLEVRINIPPTGNTQTHRQFSGGSIRESLSKTFDPATTYLFMTTVANPEAADAIKKQFDTGDPDRVRTRYDAQVSDIYLSAVKFLADKAGLDHVTYPLVRNEGVHNLDRHADQPRWPVVHALRVSDSVADATSVFERIVHGLNADAAYRHLKQREAPNNYYMHIIDLLREKSIPPFILEERKWVVDGKTLKDAADFLLQFKYSEWSTAPVIDDDD